MALATFTPPTTILPFEGSTISRWHTDRGVTVWRYNGTWYQQQDPFWGNDAIAGVKDADIVPAVSRPGGEKTDNTDRDRYLFLGGHVYTVSSAVGDELTAAGYTVVALPSDVGDTTGPAHWSELTVTWSGMTVRWSEL